MINVIFLLLIFFMLNAHAMKKVIEVDLPEAKSSEKTSGHKTTISVTQNSAIELDGQELKIESLLPALQNKLKEADQKVVILRGDKSAEFDLFGRIIDIATQAGASDFLLATDSPEVAEFNQPG